MQRLAIAALLASALPAWASEERPLSGAGIAQMLTGAEVIGEGTRQKFYQSGRTLYDDGRDSWGYWRVEGDRYCSQWPPQEGWTCYDIARKRKRLKRKSFADLRYFVMRPVAPR